MLTGVVGAGQGTVDVVVQNEDGSAKTLPRAFTYKPAP
jgi:hypothetical protein